MKNNIYLITCESKVFNLQKKCGKVVDHYVECERSIIITDVLLQEASAYKHVLYNASDYVSSIANRFYSFIKKKKKFTSDWALPNSRRESFIGNIYLGARIYMNFRTSP